MADSKQEPYKTHQMATGGGGALKGYQDLIVGSRSWGRLVYFELCMFLTNCPGALGLFLRKLMWPRLFASCGQGVMFATGVVLRHPGRIRLGERVVVSEGCILDGRNPDTEKALVLGDDVNLANDVMLSAKMGSIEIGERVGIGAKTIIHSAAGNPVKVEADVVIGPQCYIVGGGNYNTDRLDIPIGQQGIAQDGGVVIGQGVWLGAKVCVLGGVSMAAGGIAAAGAVVTKDVPHNAVVAGAPAKVIKTRGEQD
ncbi:MAG: acyltransferase [Proteobacteria bacterium]|nr:acyltransferase [Pseudomonadota bacterium]MBU1450523.1 acyltransferase [Pseudomonadota bacterium]MBU2470029.1 acyltransferase [Pseudomonadota bacterium]MBU2519208.1 acyltransferase [Pseudomonadota bacterium]